jgi:hypothetical protein
MSTYTRPDVFVTVEIPVASPIIETPKLIPCMVGEHYFVKIDEFVADIGGSESTTYPYASLPFSTNDPAKKLEVDILSDFKPAFTVITDAGDTINVTSKITATNSGFTKAAGQTLPAGSLYVTYRALSDAYAGTEAQLVTASSFEDLINLFGPDGLGPANPLGFAMYMQLIHTNLAVAGASITRPPTQEGVGQYSGVLADLPMAYKQTLDFLRVMDVFAIVPLTQNGFVMEMALAHASYMSGQGKSERRIFFAPNMTGPIAIRGGASFTPWYTITDSGGTRLSTETVGKPNGAIFQIGGFDILKVGASEHYIKGVAPSGSPVAIDGSNFTVAAGPATIIDLGQSAVRPASTRIKLTDTFAAAITGGGQTNLAVQIVGAGGHENFVKVANASAITFTGGAYKFLRTINPVTQRAELVAAYRQVARSYSNERLVLIMPDYVATTVRGELLDLPAYYAGVLLAGEVCKVGREPAGATPGAFPLTGLRDSVDNLFRSSRYFSEEEMDAIGGAGWTILVNTRPGATLTTRDTLTTDMSDIERGELILGVERDFLCRFFREEMRKDLRQFRIDAQSLEAMSIKLGAIASALTTAGSASRCFRSIDILSVIQDPEERTAIAVEVEATQLYPYKKGKVRVKIVF